MMTPYEAFQLLHLQYLLPDQGNEVTQAWKILENTVLAQQPLTASNTGSPKLPPLEEVKAYVQREIWLRNSEPNSLSITDLCYNYILQATSGGCLMMLCTSLFFY